MQDDSTTAAVAPTQRKQVTFCRICEPYCGMIATVEGDKLVSLRPDKDHPLSQGYACPKGVAYPDIQNDPDRVTHPLKRRPDGSFEQVSWEEALDDIATRLRKIRKQHGTDSVGVYAGNPAGLNLTHAAGIGALIASLRMTHIYSAGTQDTNSRFLANLLLYRNPMALALPDLADMEFLVTLGANPVMSHGSLVSIPRMKNQMNELVRRGGRILAIDPRRTETAAKFEWLPITPDTDAWLLLSLLQVMFGEGLVDESALQKAASGVETLRELTSPFNPEHTAQFTGIEAEDVRALAAELVAKRSMIYGRTGTCLGSRSTLVNYLIDAVNLAAGNLDVRGGGVFGAIPFPLMDRILRRIGGLSYKRRRSRIGNLPVFLGHQPAAEMAAEITTPGPGQLRAMFVCSGNPALSTPNGPELEKALDQLDLLVSLDLYVNETGAHADYVLPGAAMYEHPDIPATALFGTYTQPFVQATEAVVPPPGEARQEFEVLTDIARRVLLGKTAMLPLKLATGLGTRLGLRMNGRAVLDAILKFGFGNRPGQLSFAKLLRRHPHGLILADRVPFGRLPKLIGYKDRKVCLDHELIRGEITRLAEYSSDPAYPLRLIGMRESRSENSWMHNVMTDKRMLQTARLHPEDAAAIGLSDGEKVRVSSKAGSIELPVTITADIKPGVVAIPHGWGHKGGGSWQRANANPGVNINELASSDPGDIEPLAGMSHLSGIAIRLEPVSEQRSVA